MKTKLFFLAFLTSLLSWGQATLPVSRTSNWNTATVTGWTHTGTTDRTSTFACSGGNAETFDTTGDRIVLFVNAAPNQLIFKLKSASMSGASSLLVEQSNDGSTYTTLGNYGTASGATTITDCADITLSLNNATRYIRWTYTRSSGNVDIDDVSVSASAGPAPILAITPATTNLGSSCVGISTTPVVYTITNSGTVAANGVTVISSGANAANFVVSGLSSTTIAAGGTATYTVTFTPSATGVRNATITVASTTSGSNSPTTALTGTGNATVSAVVTSGAGATAILDVSATLNGNVTTLGVCPASIQKGFVYSETAVNNLPTNGGIGVTTTPGVAVGTTGAYSEGIIGLTPNTNYTYRAYVFDGVTYTYSPVRTFTTIGVPVVSNGSFSGTAGTAIATFNLSTLATNSPFTGFAITGGALPAGLSLNTTTGAITGTPTVNGSFSINFTATNSIGTSATSGTVTITINPSQNSDIVTANGEAGTISSLINNTSIATDTQGVQVWQFTIRDGGAGLNDADNLPTILTALNITSPFGTADFNDIQTAALFDGATKVSNDLNFTNTGTQLQFTGLNVNVADNTAKTLSLRISLKCPLSAATIDGDNFGFRITNGNTTFSTLGSGKSSFTNTSSINNAASVNIVSVEATQLVFTTQPPGTIGTGTTMPTIVVTAQDACGNRDYDYAGTVTLSSSGTMTAIAPVVASAGVANFNPVIHTVVGSALNLTAAGTLSVSNGTSNPFNVIFSTAFSAGDFAVLGVRSNLGCVSGGSTSQDEVSFITFREIINGDTFYITDNGFEKQGAGTNTWGNNEGLYQVTRTGGTIAIGTVITFILDSGSISFSSPDSSWSYVRPTGFTGNINLNANGDQLFFMQGGVWNNPGGTNDATYTGGTLLFAFNTNSTWTAGINTAANNTSGTGNAQNSGLPPEIKCFSLLPGSATDFVEYNGPTTITSKLGWIARLNDPSNWIDRVSCAGYLSTHVGQTYSVDPTGTFTDGVWTGVEDTNWFNCSNWDTLKVPDETTNVLLSSAKATQEAVISSTATDASLYGNIAKANNLTIAAEKVEIVGSASNILEVHGNLQISGTGILDMDDSTPAADGLLYLYGNWTNNMGNVAFEEGNGTVYFTGTSPQIINNVTPEGTETFGNLILNNNFDTSVSNNIIAKGNLTINTGRTLTITADDYAEVTNSVFNNGTFNILNDGSLVQINDLGVNTGNISYERITTGAALDYVYWSSPVNGVSTPASGYNYTWNTTVANPNGGQGNWVSATNTAMQPALGYIMRGVLNRNFIGLPRNGVYTPTIARGSDLGAGSTGPNGIMRLATDDNWNLLGNPYPSAISINSFLTANTQLDGFVRLWTHGTLPSTAIADPFYDNFVSNYTASDYVAINGAGATSGPGTLSVIGAGQGFFVLMDAGPATTSTALFNNSMRDKGYSNSQFYRINTASRTTAIAPSERHGIWLDLVSPTNETTRTLVAYVTDATYGRDRMFDAITDYKSAQNFYSIINEDVMTIQGRPVPFDNLDKVPMGVKIPSTGSYTIAIGAVDGIFASSTQDIYLEDLEFGIIHDLRVNPYSFNATQGIHNSRFVLRYTNSVLGNEDFIDDTNTVFVVSNESLTVSSLKENITAIEIYDVLGRKLYQNKNVNTQSQIVNSIQKTNSGLIIYITLENGKQVVKKAIY